MSNKLAVITGYAKDPEFVKALLLSLTEQTFQQFDCYIYASPGCLYFLEQNFLDTLPFHCVHCRLKENKGFAGNNNETIETAFSRQEYDYVVLVNDDTLPTPRWLEEMMIAAAASDSIGAIAPKMVFYQKFVSLSLVTNSSRLRDNRLLGVRFYQNSGFAHSFYPKRFYKNGFSAAEEDEIGDFRWTADHALLEIPVGDRSRTEYLLRLFVAKNPELANQRLSIDVGGEHITDINLLPGKIYYEIAIPASVIERHAHYIIQNTGSEIERDRTFEIGFGEIDNGQYELPRDLSLFCGGACLLKKKALQEAGLFMEGLFSYYEDSDLSIRLRKKGFRIVYCPAAVIRHYHTGTSREWSPMFTYYAFRNKIIFSAKTYGIKAFYKSFMERLKETYIYLKLYIRSKGKNHDYRYRLKLNIVILKDALVGIVKFKPKYLTK